MNKYSEKYKTRKIQGLQTKSLMILELYHVRNKKNL